MYLLFLIVPLITNSVDITEAEKYWLLENEKMSAKISKITGEITSIKVLNTEITSKNCEVYLSGEESNFNPIVIKYRIHNNKPVNTQIIIDKYYTKRKITYNYVIDSEALYWEVTILTKSNDAKNLNISFIIPVLKKMDFLFYPEHVPVLPIRSIDIKELVYRRDFIVPYISTYNENRKYGISIAAPLEQAKPGLSFTIKNKNIYVSYYNLRSTHETESKAALYIIPNKGDWRSGFDFLIKKYPEYFYPAITEPPINDGWYIQAHPRDNESKIKNAASRVVSWNEFHHHFPFYGLYAPERNVWGLIADCDSYTVSSWENGAGQSKNSYSNMNRLINLWQKYGIQVYLYFQSSEAWHKYANKLFPVDIARMDDGRPIPSWKYTHLMNQDPDGMWGQYIINQAKELLKKYPSIDGIFYDRMDYCNYDFSHDDGITMVQGKPAYMLGFAQEKINEQLFKIFHTANKGVWGNNPTSIEVCRNIDGIMAERHSSLLNKIQFAGLTRPILYLAYDRTPEETENKLKEALVCGAFPSTTYGNKVCQNLDEKYVPVFDLVKSRKWVLTDNPLVIPQNLRGNIFLTPSGNYIVPIINPEKTQLIPHPFDYNIPIKLTLQDAYEISHVYLLSGDWSGINELNFTKKNNNIYVNIPQHLSVSQLYLTKKNRYLITRQSSPVLVKGSKHKFVFRINDNGSNNKALFKIITPWFSETKNVKQGKVKIETTIPENIIGEAKISILYRGMEYLYSAWIVDPISIVPTEDIFIKDQDGDNIQFYVVNNTFQKVTLDLNGKFVSGMGIIKTPKKIILDAFETKLVNVFVNSPYNSEIIISLTDQNLSISRVYSVETGLSFSANDLFHDDFKRGMKTWTIQHGTWNTAKEVALAKGSKHLAVIVDNTWGDYIFEVTTRCLGSDNPKVNWLKSYIFFRIQNENNFYRFGIHGDAGVVDLYVRSNGKWKKLGSSVFVAKKEKWYKLRIQAKGNQLSCYLDNRKIIEVIDGAFLNGGIGIGVLEDGMKCEYKDVIVKKL